MQPGDRIGDYVIVRYLGEGGMSIVYLAEHKDSGLQVVVKQLQERHTSNKQFVDRFIQSAQIMRELRHPHLARALDCIESDGKYYVVEEYLSGGSLADLLNNKERIEEQQALRWCRDILRGINYAHENGIVHRDLKPGNVMLNDKGEVKVTDFGIARAFGGPRLTSTGTEMGTSAYMSPEQIQSPHDVDHLTDVYAMGIVLYELLTGDIPFDGPSDFTIKEKVIHQAPPPPRKRNPSISAKAEALVLRAIQKRPKDRFGGCHEFAVQIDKILGADDTDERRKYVIAIGIGLAAILVLALVLPRLGSWIGGDSGREVDTTPKNSPPPTDRGEPNAPGINVNITPAAAALGVSEKKKFTAEVSGTSNSDVHWSVQPEVGSIDANGIYTAPTTVHSEQMVSVLAVSAADETKSAEAKITLTPVTIRLNQTNAILRASGKIELKATVGGTPHIEVKWSAKGRNIPNGVYIAPNAILSDETFEVTATSLADPTKSATMQITLKADVAVKLEPATVNLGVSQEQLFNATVTGSTDPSVTWSVEPKVGGLKDGLFVAPRTSSRQVVTVTATSNADPSKSASAKVTLVPVSVSLSPLQVTLEAGQPQKFVAKVDGSSNTKIVWSISSGPGTLIEGTYVAPSTVVGVQTAMVKAASDADPEKFEIASVRLTPKPTANKNTAKPTTNEPERVCFFQDIQYVGQSQCFGVTYKDKNLGTFRKKISSIQFYGGASISVYENAEFEGPAGEFASDVPDLGVKMVSGTNRSWNDRIESLRVFPRTGVCVFEKAGFRGRSACWIPGQDQPDLTLSGEWSDQISSIRVFGPAVGLLFVDIDYLGGEPYTVTSDIPDLKARARGRDKTWDDAVSSLKVQQRR